MSIGEFKRPEYDRDVNELVKAYKQALVDVSERVGKLSSLPLSAIDKQQAASLASQITFIMNDLDATSLKWSRATINKGFTRGYASKIISTATTAETQADAAKLAQFSLMNRRTVEALIADTYNDLLAATNKTRYMVLSTVRRVVADQMVRKAAQQLGRRTINRGIINDLTKAGLSKKIEAEGWVGIVDKAGRRWNLTTYVDMVSRTKLHQAYIEGVKRKADDRGYDLAVISSHGAKDKCAGYEGAIISMNGDTPGYPTYGDMLASGAIFHPNCKHSVSLIRSPELLPEVVRTKAEGATERAAQAIGKTDYKGLIVPPVIVPPSTPQAPPSPYKFTPAKTIEEANEWAAQHLGIEYVNYENYAVELANSTNHTLEQLQVRYPEVRNTRFVGTSQDRNRQFYNDQVQSHYDWYVKQGLTDERALERAKREVKRRSVAGNVYAESSNSSWGRLEGIAFNEKWSQEYAKLSASVEHGVKSGFHPMGTENPASIMTHEYGHQIDNFLTKNGLRKEVIEDNWALYKHQVAKDLSQYGAKNDAEFFAEAFGEYIHNPNPREIAKTVGEALEKAFEAYRKI